MHEKTRIVNQTDRVGLKGLDTKELQCKQPTRCNKLCLLIFLNLLYMFRTTNSSILRSTFSLLVQCTDIAADRQQYQCIVTKAVFIHSLVLCLEGRVWQEPEPSHVTGMALAHCILGKFLGVVCHCFPPPSDVPTLAARCLRPQRRERC